MALVNLTEAAKLVGLTRKTIGRHVKSGKLSIQLIDKSPRVDISELMRVYGPLKNNHVHDNFTHTKTEMSNAEVGQKEGINSDTSEDNLNLEVISIKKELEMLRLLIEEKDRHIETLKSEVMHTRLLLEDKSPKELKKRWWKIFS